MKQITPKNSHYSLPINDKVILSYCMVPANSFALLATEQCTISLGALVGLLFVNNGLNTQAFLWI